jgi:hypothetical protein
MVSEMAKDVLVKKQIVSCQGLTPMGSFFGKEGN